jgi:NAD-dependent dihydropyrimidine dehydrogenase PreA subunit
MGLLDSLGFGRKDGGASDAPARPAAASGPSHGVSHGSSGGVSWAPRIDAGSCRACGTCLDECPAGVFAMGRHDKGARVARPGDCRSGCDVCARSCPEEGISFPGRPAR